MKYKSGIREYGESVCYDEDEDEIEDYDYDSYDSFLYFYLYIYFIFYLFILLISFYSLFSFVFYSFILSTQLFFITINALLHIDTISFNNNPLAIGSCNTDHFPNWSDLLFISLFLLYNYLIIVLFSWSPTEFLLIKAVFIDAANLILSFISLLSIFECLCFFEDEFKFIGENYADWFWIILFLIWFIIY